MPVVYNRIPQVRAIAPVMVERALAKTAYDTQIAAIQKAPVDTGNLVNSIQAQRTGPLRWSVTAHADYAIYVEMGTRRSTGQPYLLPALRQTWPSMMSALRSIGLTGV